MGTNTDYARMSPEELMIVERKVRRERITTAVLIGFLIGVIVYGVATKGFGLLHTLLPVALIVLLSRNSARNSQRLTAVRSELSRKRAG